LQAQILLEIPVGFGLFFQELEHRWYIELKGIGTFVCLGLFHEKFDHQQLFQMNKAESVFPW
jgi:hypothetical protein